MGVSAFGVDHGEDLIAKGLVGAGMRMLKTGASAAGTGIKAGVSSFGRTNLGSRINSAGASIKNRMTAARDTSRAARQIYRTGTFTPTPAMMKPKAPKI